MSTARSSGLIGPGTVVVSAYPNYLSGCSIISDSANTGTLTVYDSADGVTNMTDARILARVTATTTTGSNSLTIVLPIRAEIGLTAVVSGTGTPKAVVIFGGAS